jgi:2-polyprenyl-6-methoxyphenol hydroxylase-like FAD-dependent oxidoreductase
MSAISAASTDVLICGAGAAGLVLAIDLARRGVAFRLIDKAPTPFAGSRGKGIQPRSQEVFEDLGVLDRMLEIGAAPYPPIRAYAEGQFTDTLMAEPHAPTPDEPFGDALMLPQALTEGVLRERLAQLGHATAFGVELVGFEQAADGVVAHLAGPAGAETIRVRYLIGADGGRSFVRKALDVGFPGKTLGVRALVADMRIEGLSRDVWHRWSWEDGQLALCPLAGTDLFQLMAPLPLEGEPDLSDERLCDMILAHSGRDDLVIHPTVWRSAFQMNARLADRYRVGRVFLCGDAAHIHPPTGGQGLNTSLQDAYNLGWKLAAVLAGAPDALLDTYEEERRPVAQSVLGLSTDLLKAAQDRLAMRRGRETQELDLTYEGSSLAADLRAVAGRLVAGDRAPDAPCLTVDGGPIRLFEIFRGPHWTLLGHEVGGRRIDPRPGLVVKTIGAAGDLRDAAGHLRDAYDLAPGAWALVRPDGYVGLIVPVGDEAAIDTYLDEVMARPAPVRRAALG